MQAISLMSLAGGQTGPVSAQGGTQTAATAANAGLFQGMLLEALLGGQISQELAAQLQMAPQQPGGAANGQATARAPETGQSPGVLVTGPAAIGIAPAPAPAEPAPPASTAGLQNPPTMETPDPPAQPAAPKAKDTANAPTPTPATPDAVVAQVQVLMQSQAALPPATTTVPVAPDPQTTAPTAVVEQAAAEPQLEAFVQRAVKTVQGEKPEAPAAEGKAPAGPTFQDLVKLVAGADQPGGPKPEGQPSPQGQTEGQAQGEALTQAPAQTDTKVHTGTKAQTEIKAETEIQLPGQPRTQAHTEPLPAAEHLEPTPGPVKAPKAPESPEKTADVNLTQAPHPAVHEAATAASEAPQAAPRQPVDPEQVIRQVSRFVKVMVDSKQSEVRLQLHPENLGSVGVRLVLGDGALKANLVAQDAAVKAALEANLDQLKSRLTDQGFQVEQVHVTVGGGDGFGQPQHSRQGEQRQPQQPWRSQTWLNNRQEDESSPVPYQQRTTPTWFLKGTGARINSLA